MCLLFLLLSCFCHVRLCVTPQTAAHQAPRSLGFSRQEHWSELPLPSPYMTQYWGNVNAKKQRKTTEQERPEISSGESNSNPLQYSCLENPMDGEAWQAAVHGVAKSWRLHFHFSLSCIGEGNGNSLQCSCLENPRDWEAWWAAIYGVAQSAGHD